MEGRLLAVELTVIAAQLYVLPYNCLKHWSYNGI